MQLDFMSVVQLCVLTAGAVWAVATIRGTVGALAKAVADLTKAVKDLDKKLDHHEVRLALLEDRKK